MSNQSRAEDVLEIQNLVLKYAYHSDEFEFDELAELMSRADFWFEDVLRYSKDPQALKASFSSYPRAEGVYRRHFTTNLIVSFQAPDKASCASCFLWTEAKVGQPPIILMCGTYKDKFEKADGRWYFTERRIACDAAA